VTDKPTDDPGDDEGPITPEVVRRGRGAAARKRPREGDPVPVPDPAPVEAPVRRRSMFRIGCIALAALGLMLVVQGGFQVANPESTQCLNARSALLQDADDQLEDEELDDRRDEIDDLGCDDAIAEADALEDYSPPTDSAVRTLGAVIIIVGLVQIAAGLMTARTQSRTWRTVAVATAVPTIVLALLSANILLLALGGFVLFALMFSQDAKALFGGGSGFLRPRVPPAT
jgi:hypothetical protein